MKKELQKNHIYELTSKEEEVFQKIARDFDTPAYVYFEDKIIDQIKKIKKYKAPFGLTPRYAMKANPNLSLLSLMSKKGVWIDASTLNEAYRALDANIEPRKILITSQQLPEKKDLKKLVKLGVEYNATSLAQLQMYGEMFPKSDISIRFNIGIGSGWNQNNDTGGKNSSFGIYEKFEEIDILLEKYQLSLKRVHVHIGSGSDAEMQTESMKETLRVVEKYPKVKILNMGGGFKTARVKFEKETDIEKLSQKGAALLEKFYKKTGRKIKLEIEPGTFLMANGGFLLSEARDIVNTGETGMGFAKLDTGMNDNTRIPLYGAQHPIYHIKKEHKESENMQNEAEDSTKEKRSFVLVGECCESSDVITCFPDKPATQREEEFTDLSSGDLLVIGGAGAYCAGMSLGNYNSKQRPAEVLVNKKNEIFLIRKREKLKEVWKNDILL